jgi:uncharacterized membrane protein YhhN
MWIAFVASVLAFAAATALGPPALALLAKPLPVLVLAQSVFAHARGPLRRGFAIGLLASAVGDLLLGLDLFLPGLVAFLGAHLAYTVGFVADTRVLSPSRAFPFALWGGLLLGRLWPGLGGLALPVAFYVVAICAMMWRAAARVGGRPGAVWGLAGAVSFGLSDSLIAWDRFLTTIPGVAVPVMLFYWLGQAGLARTALDKETR